MKMDTCRRVRVDDSTSCSETEHRLAGTGGRLNYRIHEDEYCSSGAGGELNYLKRTLDGAGAQIELGLHGCPNQLDMKAGMGQVLLRSPHQTGLGMETQIRLDWPLGLVKQ